MHVRLRAFWPASRFLTSRPASAAGFTAIGCTNGAWKIDAFASADIVATSIDEIAESLAPVSQHRPRATELR